MRASIRLGLSLSVAVLTTRGVAAQSTTLAWEKEAATLAQAQAFVYRYFPDSGGPYAVTDIVCTGAASPFTCTAPRPALPVLAPGPHEAFIRAADASGESANSNTVSFTIPSVTVPVVPAPVSPTNLRLVVR